MRRKEKELPHPGTKPQEYGRRGTGKSTDKSADKTGAEHFSRMDDGRVTDADNGRRKAATSSYN
jgi:hypothetical protein